MTKNEQLIKTAILEKLEQSQEIEEHDRQMKVATAYRRAMTIVENEFDKDRT